MNRLRIKILLIIVVFTMITMMIGCGSVAETPADEFEYEMDDGEIIITGYLGTSRNIVIPKVIEDRPVTVIGEGAFHEYDMESIILPETIKVIQTDAFSKCDCLIEIELPESLTHVEFGAFWNCDALERVNLPENLELLGGSAFSGCDQLKTLEIPQNFSGFDIQNSLLSMEVTDKGQYQQWGDKIISPVSKDTVLLVWPDSPALRLIEEYGRGEIKYEIIGKAESDKKPEKDKGEPEAQLRYLLAEVHEYDTNDVIYYITEYSYDESGYIQSITEDIGPIDEVWNETTGVYEYHYHRPDGIANWLYRYEYDENNNLSLISTEKLREDGTYSGWELRYEYELNSNGSVAEKRNEKKYEYQYDEENRISSVTITYVEGIARQYRYSYTQNGTISKVEYNTKSVYDGGLLESSDVVFEYEDDRLQSVSTMVDGALTETFSFEYSSDGTLRKAEKRDAQGVILETRTYTTDEYGRPAEDRFEMTSGKHKRYIYEVKEIVVSASQTGSVYDWYKELAGISMSKYPFN